jgi:hypothetical protein
MISNASPVIEARQFGCILVPPIVALNAAELPDKANLQFSFAAFWTLANQCDSGRSARVLHPCKKFAGFLRMRYPPAFMM